MMPSKVILIHTQYDATYPMNCSRSKGITIRAIETKAIGLLFSRHYLHRVLAINYVQTI